MFSGNAEDIINATVENYELQQEIYSHSLEWREENENDVLEEYAL